MDTWLARSGHSRGAVVTFDQMWALAQRWYAGRATARWRGRSDAETQRIVDALGLTGEFWRVV